jgi:hypothetical protein
MRAMKGEAAGLRRKDAMRFDRDVRLWRKNAKDGVEPSMADWGGTPRAECRAAVTLPTRDCGPAWQPGLSLVA